MRRRSTPAHPLFLPACFAVIASACGNDNTPTSPTRTSSTSTITGIEVFGPRVVLTGTSVTYSSVTSFASGVSVQNQRVTVWSSDDASVVTIRSASDGIGELTAHQPGRVTIAATYLDTRGSFAVEVRDPSQQTGGARLEVTFTPDPAMASQMPCEGFPLPAPTWRFTELFTETKGIGFKVELATIGLYGDNGSQIYLSTDPEDYYFPPNSIFEEEACISLFGSPSGFYEDGLNGVDDRGEPLAFASRLRLLPVTAPTQAPTLFPFAPKTSATIKRTLRRLR